MSRMKRMATDYGKERPDAAEGGQCVVGACDGEELLQLAAALHMRITSAGALRVPNTSAKSAGIMDKASGHIWR